MILDCILRDNSSNPYLCVLYVKLHLLMYAKITILTRMLLLFWLLITNDLPFTESDSMGNAW